MTHLVHLGKYYYAEYLPNHAKPCYRTTEGDLFICSYSRDQFHTFDRRLDALRFLYLWRQATYGAHDCRQLHPNYWRLPYTYPKLLRILQSHFPQDFI